MRKIIPLQHGWYFTKTPYERVASAGTHGATADAKQDNTDNSILWESISLPHTFNAIDGADGSEYFRGECCYRTTVSPRTLLAGAIQKTALPTSDSPYPGRAVLRIGALSLRGEVYVNGKRYGGHEGGYSAFNTDISEPFFQAADSGESLEILITADNQNYDHIYPQMADFTFYGGLYRDVSIIILPEVSFDFGPHASKGLTVTTKLNDTMGEAVLSVESSINTDSPDITVRYRVIDDEGLVIAESYRPAKDNATLICLTNPHLWDGVNDPYLYRLTASLIYRNEILDQISTTFGIREFSVDPEKGFFLNRKPMMLRGVSRHQDFLFQGYALTREQHYRDAALIREIGANTVRLAHYQHSEAFYDACDEYGFIVWAEIPYISSQSDEPAAHENAKSQLAELICQNRNHPSICFWGLSNEITIAGEKPKLVEHHRELNALAKELDPTRMTTMAHVTMLPMDSPLHGITDVESYNHYFGWYGGSYDYNEKWLDEFHEKYPDICLGLSEYGAEGIITYQPDEPKCRDYSERYQALYHEHMAQILMERPYLWSTYVWNMFDFGCAARDEGGVKGRNNKGLVTMDRQINKEAFYVYKAYWSKTPFVYLCGRRYAERAQATTSVKIYSNCSQVTLYVNGKLFATRTGSRIFEFHNVPLEHTFTFLRAEADQCSDTITLKRVAEKPAIYTLPMDEEGDGVTNWFEQVETIASDAPMEFSEKYYSVHDKIKDLFDNEEAFRVLSGALSSITGMHLKKSMMKMMAEKTVMELLDGFSNMGTQAPENALQIINSELNKIKK